MHRSKEHPLDRSITPSPGTSPSRPASPRSTFPQPSSPRLSSSRSSSSPPASAGSSDFLQLNIADAPAGGRSDWLARELRRAIADGRLPVGSRLPATRTLAADLRVSRGVVTEAYQRLTEDGQLAGRGRAGTVVVAAPLTVATPDTSTTATGASTAGTATKATTARKATRTRTAGAATRTSTAGTVTRAAGDNTARPVSGPATPVPAGPFAAPPGPEIFDELRDAPARIDLSPGVPDLAAFPRAAWLRAERAVLADLPAAGLGYGDPRGTPALRQAVSHWLARNRGIRVDPDEVLIVAGTAQALGLIAQVLRRAGESAIAVEDPGSLGVRQHLQYWQVATPPIPVDDDGLCVGALRASGARAVLLTPAHQFPTGVVFGGRRRRELMHWASAGGLIVEDDYDAEHRYDRAPVPALRSLLPDQVCYVGSVSKLLAPALRVGWLLAPPRYREALVDAKRFADLGNAALPQLVLARLMESGELERRLRLLRPCHRRRRDAMIAAIGTRLPGATVHGAAAGLHLTITFDRDGSGPSGTDLATAALGRGVKVQPLSWHRQRPGRPGLVLGYAARTPGEITEGVAVLGEVLNG